MSPLEIFDTYLDQYHYYFDVKLPDLSSIQGIKKVVICGMGGSSFPGDIVADHIREAYRKDLVFVNRDYSLPYFTDNNTLIIVTSFSGSTEETLSCMKEAIDRKLPLIGISMGGEISRICSEESIPYFSIPKVEGPRFNTGYMVGAIFRALVETKVIPRQDEEFENIKIIIDPVKLHAQKYAEGLTKKIKDRIVTVYADVTNATAANIGRIAVNETAKIVGYASVFSESNHNELASFDQSPYPHAFLLLVNPTMRPRIGQRFDLLKELLPNTNVVYEKINCNFENILYRDIYYAMFFSYIGYYLALESDHDPVATPTQDSIKKLLKQKFGSVT